MAAGFAPVSPPFRPQISAEEPLSLLFPLIHSVRWLPPDNNIRRPVR